MSRIHDALKKAEEQKLASFGSSPVPDAVESSVEEFPEIALEVVVQGEGSIEALGPQLAPPPTSKPVVADEPPLLVDARQTVWSPTKDALFLTAADSHSPGLEEFRTLRAKLFQTRAKRPLKTLLISSALPAEGKSFVSANLAQAFARQRGGRTLLIDGDLRKPRLHELLGAPSSPGLFEYLAGKASESEIIQRSSSDDLFFIPGGRVNSNAAELIGNGRVQSLLDRLSPMFNWIVIDSSPVVPVSDPTRLAGLCDGVLLVVKSGSTPHLIAERAKREFHDATLLGVVFNRVPREQNQYYKYSYGEYGSTK